MSSWSRAGWRSHRLILGTTSHRHRITRNDRPEITNGRLNKCADPAAAAQATVSPRRGRVSPPCSAHTGITRDARDSQPSLSPPRASCSSSMMPLNAIQDMTRVADQCCEFAVAKFILPESSAITSSKPAAEAGWAATDGKLVGKRAGHATVRLDARGPRASASLLGVKNERPAGSFRAPRQLSA